MVKMDPKTVMEILRHIGTYKTENGEEQADLYANFNGKDYTVEEMAGMISTLDVNGLSSEDKDFLDNLNRRLTNDNMSDNKYKNEDTLLGPLSQKVDEYNYVVNNEEFKTNTQTLEDLKSKNQNLSSLNIINLKESQTDSNLSLDYVTVRRPDGHSEMIPISDPDYLDRFVDEHADDIANMSDDELYNTLKNSTESELQFVDINKYLSDKDTRTHMVTPKNQDEQMVGYEIDEVRRLVNQFIPGTPIEITVDRNGEIFYRANDAIFKGINKDGKREVTCLQQPGLIESYDHNVAASAMSSAELEDAINKEQNETIKSSKAVDTDRFVKPVALDPAVFIDLMKNKEDILNGDDEDKMNILLDQLNAAIEMRSEENLFSGVQKVVTDYLSWRYADYQAMQKGDVSTYGKPLSSREVGLIEKLKNIDSSIDVNRAKKLFDERNREQDEALMNENSSEQVSAEQTPEQVDEEQSVAEYFEFDGEEQTENNEMTNSNVVDIAPYLEQQNNEENNIDNSNNNIVDMAPYLEQQNSNIVNFEEYTQGANEMDQAVGMYQSAPTHTVTQGRTRSLVKSKNSKFRNGLSMLIVLIEIATIALIVMMFLSLDI